MANKTLRLILGDQLNYHHSWYKNQNKDTIYVMMELRQETDYVMHHIQKVTAFFAAMRAFATHLQSQNLKVVYLKLDHENARKSLTDNLSQYLEEYSITTFEYQQPDEYRLSEQLASFAERLSISNKKYSSEHFLVPHDALEDTFGEKPGVMESFYRKMRLKYKILLDEDKPIGGKWNFDEENRKSLPKSINIPIYKSYAHDVKDIVQVIQENGVKSFGNIDAKNFHWPTSRQESLQYLQYFHHNLLHNFGKYQDAMHTDEPFLFHSRLSFALNTKMLHPLEVIEKTIAFAQENQDSISLAQVEGFVRQILGWREYMRGVYWTQMPEYAKKNFLQHSRKLPDFYWNGKTNMRCMQAAISQSLDHAYAHHIQRLMVTGNFALLANLDPKEVSDWYLGIYIDAIEWVEMPNTRGMSQFADGGIVATKPYIASANYINKMSNYCKNCQYNHREKTGENACPFNSLYWNFLDQHQSVLGKNHRMAMMYKNWERKDAEERTAILKQAAYYLENINSL